MKNGKAPTRNSADAGASGEKYPLHGEMYVPHLTFTLEDELPFLLWLLTMPFPSNLDFVLVPLQHSLSLGLFSR